MFESETTVGNLYTELKDLPEGADRDGFYYLIFARVAAALENQEPGSEKLQITMGKAWIEAANYMQKVANENPQKALRLALKLTTLPRSNSKEEKVYRWIRGDGPLSLAMDEIKQPFLEYLQNDPQADQVTETLLKYMNYKFVKVRTKAQAFSDPDCFLGIATLFLGTKLAAEDSNPKAQKLLRKALKKLAKPEVCKVVRYFKDMEDTAWIVEALEAHLSSNSS